MMKTTLRLTSALLCVLAFNACAILSPEDRDFYGRGWVNPKELDEKPYRPPATQETAGTLESPAVQATQPSAPTPDDPLLR